VVAFRIRLPHSAAIRVKLPQVAFTDCQRHQCSFHSFGSVCGRSSWLRRRLSIVDPSSLSTVGYGFLPAASSRTGRRGVMVTGMPQMCIIMHMRTTLNIEPHLLREAGRLTGVSEKTALVRMGLEALISRESARRLAALGGTEKSLSPTPRRRPPKAS